MMLVVERESTKESISDAAESEENAFCVPRGDDAQREERKKRLESTKHPYSHAGASH